MLRYFAPSTPSTIPTTDDASPPASKKPKTTKRYNISGYNDKLIEEAICSMKKACGKGGGWRKFAKMKVRYTIITKDWKYGDNKFREYTFSPLGMVESITKRLNAKSTYNQAKFISPEVKAALEITDDTYDINQMSIDVSNQGDLGEKEFYHKSCETCTKNYLPAVLKMNRGKLNTEEPKIIDLISSWDKLNLSPTLMDLAGCFFARESHVNCGPNGRRFIQRPTEHTPLHSKIKLQLDKCSSSTSNSQPPSASSSTTLATNDGVLSVKVAKKYTEIKNKDTCVSFHKGVKIAMQTQTTIFESMKGVPLNTPCKDDIDKWSKRSMLRLIHTGVRKMISNEATLELYDTQVEGAQDYHNVVLKKVKVNDEFLPPPIRVLVNKNNVHLVHEALLRSFKKSTDPENPYHVLLREDRGEFYSLMHDGIQKFGMELNGVIVRTINNDIDVVNVPWSLKMIEGGSMNADKLVIHMLKTIASVENLGNRSADKVISHTLLQKNDALSFPSPPIYFHACTVLHFDADLKIISLEMPRWPVGINADGCSTNEAGAMKLTERYGLVSPSMRCVVHAGDGSLKRLANSKTMNVEAVSEFLIPFRKVMKHFQLSGKSTSALNDELHVMGMKKVHLFSFCPTRMMYLLTCCAKSVELVVPLCDVLVTLDLKKEQRDAFMSPKSMSIMHILADLDPTFRAGLLKQLDTDDGLIINAYRINEDFYKQLEGDVKFPKLESFLNSLNEDEYGNIKFTARAGENDHDITLNCSHRPIRATRNAEPQDRTQMIKEEAQDLQKQILNNLVANVKSQIQSGTLVEYASAFDMHSTRSLEDRLNFVQSIGNIYCKSYVHKVDDKNQDEFWQGYQISIRYPAKINGGVDELVKEYKDIWPTLNKLWRPFASKYKKSEGNRKFWLHILSIHSVTHPNLCTLIEILFSVAMSTGPLERSYSKLAKICYKDRNRLLPEHLETLYLLSLLNGFDFVYEDAILELENA